MLEFQGELSNSCKNYIIKRRRTISTLIFYCVDCVFAIPCLVCAFLFNWSFILAFFALLIIPIFQFFSYKGEVLEYMFPIKILIYESYIQSIGKKISEIRELNEITKIVDFGDWYHVFFAFPNRSETFVIQKDLIVKGTIQDFEKMFEDKIVRKK